MSQHIIVHPKTGTIIDASECIILNIGALTPESFDEDDTIISLAKQYGSPIIPF